MKNFKYICTIENYGSAYIKLENKHHRLNICINPNGQCAWVNVKDKKTKGSRSYNYQDIPNKYKEIVNNVIISHVLST